MRIELNILSDLGNSIDIKLTTFPGGETRIAKVSQAVSLAKAVHCYIKYNK